MAAHWASHGLPPGGASGPRCPACRAAGIGSGPGTGMSTHASASPEAHALPSPRGQAVHPPQVRALRVLLLIDSLGLGGAERLMLPLAAGLRARGIDARVMYLVHR